MLSLKKKCWYQRQRGGLADILFNEKINYD